MPRKPPNATNIRHEGESTSFDPSTLPTPSLTSTSLRMSYRIARGEQGVLTFEPYKSLLLPHWRFRTIPIAQSSSRTLKACFDYYVDAGDFVGADMGRKFVQMGMTRARRYANHRGGRKYDRTEREVKENPRLGRMELPKSAGHEGMEEKAAASEVFKKVWRSCIEDEEYLRLKGEFQKEQKKWDREQKNIKKEDDADVELKPQIKEEDDGDG